jgi:hypothetical protein
LPEVSAAFAQTVKFAGYRPSIEASAMAKQKFLPLTEREQRWIADHLEAAGLFVAAMSPADGDRPIALEVLDRAWGNWLGSEALDGALVNETINSVGVQFGQFLVDQLGFAWTIVEDAQGTDLAVRALPGRGDVLVFPANFVAKRWQRRELNFLASSFALIRDQVATVASGQASSTKRPWWRLW